MPTLEQILSRIEGAREHSMEEKLKNFSLTEKQKQDMATVHEWMPKVTDLLINIDNFTLKLEEIPPEERLGQAEADLHKQLETYTAGELAKMAKAAEFMDGALSGLVNILKLTALEKLATAAHNS